MAFTSFYELILIGSAALLIAGTIKGLAGIGLPTAAVSIMTLALAPRTAIALLLLPMLAANAWQVYRAGDALRALRQYAPFAFMLALFVLITILLSAQAPDRFVFAVLGVSIVSFCAINLTFQIPALPERYDTAAQVIAGILSGLLGGLSGIWAAPLGAYLTARQTPKEEFLRATGLLIFIGSLPLCFGYLQQGFMTPKLALISALLILPTLLGFSVGERLRRDLLSEKFRFVFLVVFLVMGLNLLRRGLF